MSGLVVSENGSEWRVKSEGDTLVWTFEEGMELSKLNRKPIQSTRIFFLKTDKKSMAGLQ
jgi:hypothetical protein